MSTVSLYIRLHGSRKYEKATNYCLRYVRNGKRVFEILKDCPDLL